VLIGKKIIIIIITIKLPVLIEKLHFSLHQMSEDELEHLDARTPYEKKLMHITDALFTSRCQRMCWSTLMPEGMSCLSRSAS